MILSQLSYLGCIISPDKDQMLRIKNIIDRFVVGKLNIAKDRIYRPPELGGLGMIDIGEFIVSQQVVWIKRTFLSTRDNWRFDLKLICKGNALILGNNDIPASRFPLLSYMAESFGTFLKAFNLTNDNLCKSFLINNPLLKRGRVDNSRLNIGFFSSNIPRLDEQSIVNIKINEISHGGRLLSLDEISLNTGMAFSLATYLRLQESFFASRKLLVRPNNSDGSSLSLSDFFSRFKKGSKNIRKILCNNRCASLKVEDTNNIRTFVRNSGINVESNDVKKSLLSFWSLNYLPMDLREFSFKFFNNSLGTNHRIANYIPGRAAGCFFCSTTNNGPVPSETVVHLFFECFSVRHILSWFENNLLSDLNFDTREKRIKFWLFGILPDNDETQNIFSIALAQSVLFSIWRTKLLKRLPIRLVAEMETFYTLNRIASASSWFRDVIANLNIMLCRNWDTLRSRRG